MKNITRSLVKEQRVLLQKELDLISKKLGFSINIKNASFTDEDMTFKVNFRPLGKNGKATIPTNLTREGWNEYYKYVPSLKGMFGKILSDGCKIVGYNPNARKNKVMLEINGKQYTCSGSYVEDHKIKETKVVNDSNAQSSNNSHININTIKTYNVSDFTSRVNEDGITVFRLPSNSTDNTTIKNLFKSGSRVQRKTNRSITSYTVSHISKKAIVMECGKRFAIKDIKMNNWTKQS